MASLSLSGNAVGGGPKTVAMFRYATFSVAFAPGALVASCLAADGSTVLATSAPRASWGAPAAVRLSLDAPSAATGTGGALFLDGQDAALVRATVVDAQGNVVEDAANTVSFAVASGPGFVTGTGNGDPSSHEPNHAATRLAYHGLVRAVVRVTQASAVASAAGAGGDAAVALLQAVNVDAGKGGRSASIVVGGAATPIVVTASSAGLAGDSLSIATSNDFADSVLQVAQELLDLGFLVGRVRDLGLEARGDVRDRVPKGELELEKGARGGLEGREDAPREGRREAREGVGAA